MPFLKPAHGIPRSQKLEDAAQRQGLRHAIFNVVGDKYIGEWKKDVKTGKGAMLTRFRQLYEGDFRDGYRDGFGLLAYELENKVFVLEYRGGWKKGRMHGFGVRKYRDGGIYTGYWKSGKRHGYGHMWFSNGDFYAGDWVKDMRQGLGMLVLPNVNRYEGVWHQDLKHGKGRYLHLDTGQMMDGVWKQGTCIYSIMKDIWYRQTSNFSTPYPILEIKLLNLDEVCSLREVKALETYVRSCLSVLQAELEGLSVKGED